MSQQSPANIVKSPHQIEKYSPQEILEFKLCADPVFGPQYFLNNYFWIQHPTKGRLQFKPFEYQTRLIDVYHNYRLSVNMLSRQLGKCLLKSINITIRNKHGNVYIIPIGKFCEYNDAKREGRELPDISPYMQTV